MISPEAAATTASTTRAAARRTHASNSHHRRPQQLLEEVPVVVRAPQCRASSYVAIAAALKIDRADEDRQQAAPRALSEEELRRARRPVPYPPAMTTDWNRKPGKQVAAEDPLFWVMAARIPALLDPREQAIAPLTRRRARVHRRNRLDQNELPDPPPLTLLALASVFLPDGVGAQDAAEAPPAYDVVIRNGRVLDGAGNPVDSGRRRDARGSDRPHRAGGGTGADGRSTPRAGTSPRASST